LRHLEEFLAGTEVPSFVARAFRGFLDCGVLARGFVRVFCPRCKRESLVAFSCKDRGFCPSCTARRAAQTAAHLVDEVIPHVPVRQFVLAFPFDLHHRLARDSVLESRLLALFVEELAGRLRRATGEENGQAGSVTVLQHFGSGLNLHVHFHVLLLDGVYVEKDGVPLFRRAPEPSQDDLEDLVSWVAARARKLAGQTGTEQEPVVLEPLLKVHAAPPDDLAEPRLAAECDGFNLHASPALEASERVALERLCRYVLRGPLALGRLSEGPRGRLVYRLKSPRRDGTTHIVLSPMAFLQRLSWLVPLPRIHLTRYHGVLAPNHPWRNLVVAKPLRTGILQPPGRIASRWIDWATLLRRVWAFEVMVCATCGGPRRVIQVVKEGPVARKILAHLGLSTQVPRPAPFREGQPDLWETGPPAAEPRIDSIEWDQRQPEMDTAT
jgi:hypothetical protein